MQPPILVPAGQKDEHTSQGWFKEVDRHFIQHTFTGKTTDVDVCAIIPESGIVEFWRSAIIDRGCDRTSVGWAGPLNEADILLDHVRTLGICRAARSAEEDIDLIGSSRTPPNVDIKDIVVLHLKGNLPSRTWPIRRALLLRFSQFMVGCLPYILDLALGFRGHWMTQSLTPNRWRTMSEHHHIWASSGPLDADTDEGAYTRRKLSSRMREGSQRHVVCEVMRKVQI